MNFTESILERNGCSIHYWTGGKADAPLVVFTHGATIDHHEWDATLPLVGEHFPGAGLGCAWPRSFAPGYISILSRPQQTCWPCWISWACPESHPGWPFDGRQPAPGSGFSSPGTCAGAGNAGLHLEFHAIERIRQVLAEAGRPDLQTLSIQDPDRPIRGSDRHIERVAGTAAQIHAAIEQGRICARSDG